MEAKPKPDRSSKIPPPLAAAREALRGSDERVEGASCILELIKQCRIQERPADLDDLIRELAAATTHDQPILLVGTANEALTAIAHKWPDTRPGIMAALAECEPKRGRGRPHKAETKSAAERMREYRQRKLDAGMRPLNLWVPGETWASIEALAKARNQSRDTLVLDLLRVMVCQINELVGELAADSRTREPIPERPSRKTGTVSESDLMKWYTMDLPAREGLRSMPLPWTWKRYVEHCTTRSWEPDRSAFLKLVNELADRGRIALSAHDAPYNLQANEVEICGGYDDQHRVLYYWTPISK